MLSDREVEMIVFLPKYCHELLILYTLVNTDIYCHVEGIFNVCQSVFFSTLHQVRYVSKFLGTEIMYLLCMQ